MGNHPGEKAWQPALETEGSFAQVEPKQAVWKAWACSTCQVTAFRTDTPADQELLGGRGRVLLVSNSPELSPVSGTHECSRNGIPSKSEHLRVEERTMDAYAETKGINWTVPAHLDISHCVSGVHRSKLKIEKPGVAGDSLGVGQGRQCPKGRCEIT